MRNQSFLIFLLLSSSILVGCNNSNKNEEPPLCDNCVEILPHNNPFEDFTFTNDGKPWLVGSFSTTSEIYRLNYITYEDFTTNFFDLTKDDFVLVNERLNLSNELYTSSLIFIYPDINESIIAIIKENKLIIPTGEDNAFYIYENKENNLSNIKEYISINGSSFNYEEDFDALFK